MFERIGWIERDFFLETKYLGEVYVGVNSDYVGIKANLEKGYYVDKWYRPGVEVRSYSDDEYYVSNCYMSYSISFDDIRMLMYSEKLIDSYELGKATNDEIIDVLAYARKHFEVSNKTKTNTKTLKFYLLYLFKKLYISIINMILVKDFFFYFTYIKKKIYKILLT